VHRRAAPAITEGAECVCHTCSPSKLKDRLLHIILLLKHCERVLQALPEAYKQRLREHAREDAQS
jgi:hypothetical protein